MRQQTSLQTPVVHPPIARGLTAKGARYDVEADWILMSTCNFRCTYCYWSPEDLGRKIHPIADPQTLNSFFDQTNLTWLLHLTGGEPFHYPKFIELSTLLTGRHFISINTNADSRRIPSFVDVVDPTRVDFINCGAHVEQRTDSSQVERFIGNYRTFIDAGFDAFASCVMYPPIFPQFAKTWGDYAREGVALIPKALQGIHFGRLFPESYTPTERSLFIEYSERAQELYRGQIVQRRVRPTIDPFLDRELFLDGLADHRGSMCFAGRHFVRIREDGEIRRCGPGDVVGHLTEGWFERRPGPSRCVDVECPYFCQKYVARSSNAEDPTFSPTQERNDGSS